MDYDKGLAVSDHLIGQAWYSLGEVFKAKVAFLSALERHRKYGTERYQSLCLAYLGKIAQLERQYAMAEQLLLEARGKAQKVNSLENLVIIEEGLFELYRNTGRVEEAFDAMMLQYAYRDSINSAKNKQSIQQLEVVYETRQKEHQIELLSKESMLKTQRMRLGGGIIFLMILIIVLISVLYSLKQRNALVIEAGLQHRLSRSQMNPHFVSNAMSSIQKYVMENDPGNAMMYLGKFSILNRAVLEHSMLETIPLSEEIDILRRYLEFEQLRLGNSFSYTFDIQENLDAEMIYIAPLFIQPFVENAVKHGVKDMKGEGMIRIRFSDMGKVLKVEIIDNGVGMDVAGEVESLHQSRSMEIIKKRLHLLRRKYKKLPDMEIKSGFSGPGGVHVVIYLPII
ncbi:MAG: sensor histidine kinase, partial [Bacteroidota bacterium]